MNNHPILTTEDLTYIYQKGSKNEVPAIRDISIEIMQGELVGIIGHTGSGKSTLIEHFNALKKGTSGRVLLDSEDIWADKSKIRAVRFRVGVCFQYPEYQLFEETVEKDIKFGPSKMGYDNETCDRLMRESLPLVGLSEDILKRSPFELSGGQKRRVAFAGILAMNPDVLILDEPAAGLDPAGQKEIFGYIEKLRDQGKSIVLVSHDMDEAARIADRVLVLKKGEQVFFGSPKKLFSKETNSYAMRLDKPCLVQTMSDLKAEYPYIDDTVFDVTEAAESLVFGDMKEVDAP